MGGKNTNTYVWSRSKMTAMTVSASAVAEENVRKVEKGSVSKTRKKDRQSDRGRERQSERNKKTERERKRQDTEKERVIEKTVTDRTTIKEKQAEYRQKD